MTKILIAASGTGGHIFPALSVAEALPQSWRVIWLGVPDRLETQLVPTCYSLQTLRVGGIQGGLWKKILRILQLLISIKKVVDIITSKQIKIVFTTGGYIAAPTILGACICRVPVILHESNAVPGRVTRLLGRFCTLVAIGFPIAAKKLPNCRLVVTGNPVRKEFLISQPLPKWVPLGKGPLLIVIGGSQGAVALNEMVGGILLFFLEKGCRVVHITGDKNLELKKINHKNYVTKSFTNDIPALLQNAALVISRAGAGSLSELAISGTPAILVPFPQATDYHQEVNANCAAELGAAVIVHQHLPHELTLKNTLKHLLEKRISGEKSLQDPLKIMELGMKKLAFNIRGSQQKIVDLLFEII